MKPGGEGESASGLHFMFARFIDFELSLVLPGSHQALHYEMITLKFVGARRSCFGRYQVRVFR